MRNRAQIWISAIIYMLVAVGAMVLVLNAGIPLLNEVKERAMFNKIKDIMIELDNQFTQLSSQGEGSQVAIGIDVKSGKITFKNGEMIWEFETENEIISPRSRIKIGNLLITSNANVRTYTTNNSYVMETSIEDANFSVKIKRIGSKNNLQLINTSNLIESISYNGKSMNGKFKFLLNDNESSTIGWGYTELYPEGNNSHIGRAKVIAHLDTNFSKYDIEFILESYSDFLTIKIKNFEAR